MSLELATTSELIEELFSRTTFAGVLIYSPVTHKINGQCHPRFQLKATTEDRGTLLILEKGIEALKEVTEDKS